MEGVFWPIAFSDLDHTSAMSIEPAMSAPLPQPETFMEKAKRKTREEPLVTAGTDERLHFLTSILMSLPFFLLRTQCRVPGPLYRCVIDVSRPLYGD